ncbi:GNAT family N-acetyltransferase [Streptomyces sp. AC495_CC817]|uniref:GNAT family N-acetyltransferase n=1 Tax=Streptomyces sp. AC495_CC817 TaxID=2823900 RepID=UPI001C268484|nr:GNAT family N-acetyltransferase [Streptomyces sp. AC495_CC817]
MTATEPVGDLAELRIVPANEARWEDLQAVLTGTAGRCQCERQRLGDGDWWHMPVEERRDLLRSETGCDDPRATETVGIVAHLGAEAVAWCAVDRRSVYGRLRGSSVPWKGRAERKDDDGVWAIACLIVRPGYRGRGLMYPLVAAAVEHARERGATAIEGYPMRTDGATVAWGELNVGAIGPFTAAGFVEVSRPTTRRVVMRREF